MSSWSRARTVGDKARTVVFGPRLIVPLDILKIISFSIKKLVTPNVSVAIALMTRPEKFSVRLPHVNWV